MGKTSILIFISFMFFVGAVLTRRSMRKEQKIVLTEAMGTIDRVIFSDGGNVKYYVKFQVDGKELLAQTEHYTSDTKSLNPGDTVMIGYYFTKKGTARAKILEEGLIPCAVTAPKFAVMLFAVGMVFFLIGILSNFV